tara:strand:+ start:87 stop:362 length:276 start_codon:yes stop_codon:yes gene_type:complete
MDEIKKVLKERGAMYGQASEQFDIWEGLSKIWLDYNQKSPNKGNRAFCGLIRMALLKLTRIGFDPKIKDSWLDIKGYIELAEKEIFKDDKS